MKHLILIIHDNLKSDMADQLRSMKRVRGFTFSAAEGHGRQSDDDPSLATRDRVVGYTPHVRVDVLLDDADVRPVLAELRESRIGLKQHCLYWVAPVDESGRL